MLTVSRILPNILNICGVDEIVLFGGRVIAFCGDFGQCSQVQ